MVYRFAVLVLALAGVVAFAGVACAEHVAPEGTITITIQDEACRNAPNYPPNNVLNNCKSGTAVSSAAVRIQSDDVGVAGFAFDAKAIYSGMSTKGTGLGKGVCPLMPREPAQKHCIPDSNGTHWLEPTLLDSSGIVGLVEGMSPGSNLAWELARHYDETDPFMLPILTQVAWVEDNRYDDARVASWVVLSFTLEWCLPDPVTLQCN